MKRWVAIVFSLSLFFLLVVVTPTHAISGPAGMNYIRTEAGPGTGQITINWQRFHQDVSNYIILYGTSPAKYQYGTGQIGNIATYTVGHLTPGLRYYFRLYPYRNGQLSDPVSPEFSDVALAVPHTVIGTSGPYGQRKLTAVKGPRNGQITLTWNKLYPDVNAYHITYGLKPGKYIYGAQDIGASSTGLNTFTVGFLTPGVRYYFAVTPSRGGQSLYDSAEVSQVAQ